jgi:hypothetical protein
MKLRVSSSIEPFRVKAEKAWGLDRYIFPYDTFKPALFFGLYHWLDYVRFIFHNGKKCIVWAGSDIINLKRHKIIQRLVAPYTNYCENNLESEELFKMGILAFIRPTFLEDINDFPISYQQVERPNIYLSAHPGRENEYGFGLIERIASRVPECIFHLYGAHWPTESQNIICHGKVAPGAFNEQIRGFQCGLRTNEHDGFSEITAKSILMGQYPITRIKYKMIDSYANEEELITLLKDLKNKPKANQEARNYYRQYLNDFPFINKKA